MPSTLPVGHGGFPQYWIFTSARGKNILFFLETWRPELGSNMRSPIFQADSFNHCTRAPASVVKESFRKFNLNAIDQELIHVQAPQTSASNQLEELCSLPEYQFNHARRLKRPPWFNRQRTEWHGIGVFFYLICLLMWYPRLSSLIVQ